MFLPLTFLKVIWYIHLIDFMHINVHENKLIWPKLMTLHPVNRGYINLTSIIPFLGLSTKLLKVNLGQMLDCDLLTDAVIFWRNRIAKHKILQLQ